MNNERIAKFIAHTGFCSRREAEELIIRKKVKVNGELITSPAIKISEQDIITIEEKEIKRNKEVKLWLFYKPKGTITTHKDPQGRKTVFEILPSSLPRVISVGRLDYNSEGLLLLSNNGEFTRHLELPSTALERKYRARIYGELSPRVIKLLSQGVVVEGIRYGKIIVTMDNEKAAKNYWINVSLHEGKNREIRKVLKHFKIEVSKLIRVEFGPFNIGDLEPGEVREVSYNRVKSFMQDINFKQ